MTPKFSFLLSPNSKRCPNLLCGLVLSPLGGTEEVAGVLLPCAGCCRVPRLRIIKSRSCYAHYPADGVRLLSTKSLLETNLEEISQQRASV